MTENSRGLSPSAAIASALPAHAPHPHEPTAFGRGLYWTAHFIFSTCFGIFWRMKVAGLENVPRDGGVLFASNHLSLADPPLVGCALPRMIYFMAKQELFEIPLFGWVIRQVNAFPIKRVERDVGAFKTAQRILSAGGALILFPEGTRQKDGRFGRPKAGVGMLAIKTGCRVVPVYVHNSHLLPFFKPLRICFGPPLSSTGQDDYQAFSNRVMDAIARLKETHCGTAN